MERELVVWLQCIYLHCFPQILNECTIGVTFFQDEEMNLSEFIYPKFYDL